jgi:hypothetical protein
MMEMFDVERLPPEKAMEILRKEGLEVSYKEAELILEFLYKFAKTAISIYMKKDVENVDNTKNIS